MEQVLRSIARVLLASPRAGATLPACRPVVCSVSTYQALGDQLAIAHPGGIHVIQEVYALMDSGAEGVGRLVGADTPAGRRLEGDAGVLRLLPRRAAGAARALPGDARRRRDPAGGLCHRGLGDPRARRMCGRRLGGDPVSNGGSGSYSMPSWIAWATSSPAISRGQVSAMSMPDDTPAAVTILPCSTTRSASGRRRTRERVERDPVRRRREPVEQPGGAEQQRAGADRRRPRRGRVRGADPVERALVLEQLRACRTRRARRARRASGRPRAWPRRRARAAACRCVRAAASAPTKRTRGAGQAREHLVRPDGVEGGEAVVERDRDVHGGLLVVGGQAAKRSAVGGGARRRAAGRTRAASSRRCRSRSGARRPRSAPRPISSASARALDAQRLDVRGGRHARSRAGRRGRSCAGSCTRARRARAPTGRRRGGRRSTPAARAAARGRRPARRAGR